MIVLAGGGLLYRRFGHPTVVATNPAFPLEAQIVPLPLGARIARETQSPPFGISEDVFESGDRIYQASCAICHGTPGHDSPIAKWMYPAAPQLWRKHRNSSVVGV